jgi:hypothetical protein
MPDGVSCRDEAQALDITGPTKVHDVRSHAYREKRPIAVAWHAKTMRAVCSVRFSADIPPHYHNESAFAWHRSARLSRGAKKQTDPLPGEGSKWHLGDRCCLAANDLPIPADRSPFHWQYSSEVPPSAYFSSDAWAMPLPTAIGTALEELAEGTGGLADAVFVFHQGEADTPRGPNPPSTSRPLQRVGTGHHGRQPARRLPICPTIEPLLVVVS